MHDKMAALVNLGKHLGKFKEGAEFTGHQITVRWLEEGESLIEGESRCGKR